MSASRYPCRVCERSTEGEDSYTVCSECLADLELRSGEQTYDRGAGHHAPDGGSGQVPLAPDEIEARLRRLLDDW